MKHKIIYKIIKFDALEKYHVMAHHFIDDKEICVKPINSWFPASSIEDCRSMINSQIFLLKRIDKSLKMKTIEEHEFEFEQTFPYSLFEADYFYAHQS